MKAPAFMQAMPSRCLLMLTVISFPPGLRLRQFCPSGSRLGFGAGGWNWRDTGGDTGFFLRANGASSPPGFDRRVPLRFAGWSGISWSGIVSDSTCWKIL